MTVHMLEKYKGIYPLYWKKSPIKEFIVTNSLYSKITSTDETLALDAIEKNIGSKVRQEVESNAVNKKWKYKEDILKYGNHFLPDVFNSKTLMSAANPPDDIPSMTRLPIFVGDLYAPNVLIESLKEVGISLSKNQSFLDFGCSSARVLRNLYAAFPDINWYGCDPQKPAITWASDKFPSLKLSHSNEDPPLDYGDSSFDGCFAFSIWSHFSEKMAVKWLDEMYRITKKGGFLFLTTCGVNTIDTLINRHPPRWPDKRIDYVFKNLLSNGFLFENEYGEVQNFALDPNKYGMAYFIIDWIVSYIPGKWSLKGYKPARSGHQDVYILERI